MITKSRKFISTFLILIICLSLIPMTAQAATYSDVPETHWAYTAVEFVTKEGFLTGYPDGSFRPDGLITRVEMAVIMCRIMKITPGKTPVSPITDNNSLAWYYDYVNHAAAEGWMVTNSSGSFFPVATLTRQEASRAAAYLAGCFSPIFDYSAYAYSYTDAVSIGPDYKSAVGFLTKNGIIGGYPDGSYRPDETITRAQLAYLIQQVISELRFTMQGDINRDGDVNILDLSALLANFGKSAGAITNHWADINGDGDVNILDLSILLANFGKQPVLVYTTAVTQGKLYTDLNLSANQYDVKKFLNGVPGYTDIIQNKNVAPRDNISGSGNGVLTVVYRDNAGVITIVQTSTYPSYYSSNYAIVNGTRSVDDGYGNITYYCSLSFPDGTALIDVEVTADAISYRDQIVSYTINSEGKYTLGKDGNGGIITDYTNLNLTLSNGNQTFSWGNTDYTATKNTIFVVQSVFRVQITYNYYIGFAFSENYTGFDYVPGLTDFATGSVHAIDGIAQFVYVRTITTVPVIEDLTFIAKMPSSFTVTETGVPYYEVGKAMVNGVIGTNKNVCVHAVIYGTSTVPAPIGLYDAMASLDGVALLFRSASIIDKSASPGFVLVQSEGTINADGEYFAMAPDIQVYTYNTTTGDIDQTTTAAIPATSESASGQRYFYMLNNNAQIKVLFIDENP